MQLTRWLGGGIVLIALVAIVRARSTDKAPERNPIEVTPEQVADALEAAYGVHPGERRNHAKGTCAIGTFVGTPDAAKYSRSALFSGVTIPVVARFSLAGGDPHGSDTERSPRGMALEFRLPNGALQHMTMINTPMFFAAMPRTFLDKMLALRPDPKTGKPDPDAMAIFKESHPESRRQTTYLEAHNPPASYASSAYFGIHTFKFLASDDGVTLVKWRFDPEGGERLLDDDEMAQMPPDFLEARLIEQTQKAPVRWTMWVTVGRPDDPQDDPTIEWPKDRPEVQAGTLTITSAMVQTGAGCEAINYDPLVMADGIAPTNDPVLLFRSPSYGVSASRRLQEQ
jgi:catalase